MMRYSAMVPSRIRLKRKLYQKLIEMKLAWLQDPNLNAQMMKKIPKIDSEELSVSINPITLLNIQKF